jgi:hypothetical protein
MSALVADLDPRLAALFLLIIFGFVIWIDLKRDGRSLLQSQYLSPFMPAEPYVECDIRFPLDEMSTRCLASASKAGLYLVSPTEAISKWRWTNNTPLLRQPVMIPWSELIYGRARFPMHNWIRFGIQNTKATFFIRKAAAIKLLESAGRTLN